MENIKYFGFASNPDQSTLDSRLIHPSKYMGIGVLKGYGFRFNHKNPNGSARANIIVSPNETVYGALYQLHKDDIKHFLKSEKLYDFKELDIQTKNGELKVFTFISPQNISAIFPEKEYLETILKGAKNIKLPNTYISSILNRNKHKLY
ncbi:gamma-glutamylcyclotransferase family protein [Echinicola shivajiensis]|uniref:gamma-glutamylcyclotransferase family protein n=1 Tax=Echinicola shivajiensis TaxID=1035916 RepID=UPI001BFC3AB7|nr:gamma-glutamylcyclotransferase family protein [Echinicola shivajiensis]